MQNEKIIKEDGFNPNGHKQKATSNEVAFY